MNMQKVILMVGPSGSGKSTFAKQESERLSKQGYRTTVISRDEVRKALLGPNDSYFDKEKEVFNAFVKRINKAIEFDIDYIFVDATHLNPPSRDKILSRLKPKEDTVLQFEVFLTSLDTCIARNEQREGFAKVPQSAIKNMFHTFETVQLEEIPSNKWGFAAVYEREHWEEQT